ncbi:hypothetical protein M2405_006198 [Rhodococcus erythropolis]|uniref:B-4DMT family transporter n=1 Tax=Rhodococcus erythropolis TaxID=1833 RepID=UPI002167F166|nr:B-4DMT family transporter [Rhodococcus erythropolis]MCS4257871.1 hypothetical protein [Rhodococcus erythropolis]MCW2425176.1 hypothetical protein [Rhodococcus erythropolis]
MSTPRVETRSWVTRGLVMGGVLVATRAVVGHTVGIWPSHGTALRMLGLGIIVAVALSWGFSDGRRDRSKHPDPDRGGEDLTVRWLAAGALAGFSGGLVAWLAGKVGLEVGDKSLLFEMTSGAAWTILLVFLAALVGKVLGAALAARSLAAAPPVRYSATAAER